MKSVKHWSKCRENRVGFNIESVPQMKKVIDYQIK